MKLLSHTVFTHVFLQAWIIIYHTYIKRDHKKQGYIIYFLFDFRRNTEVFKRCYPELGKCGFFPANPRVQTNF